MQRKEAPPCRAREGVKESDVSVHVCIFLFDILLHQGDILLHSTFRERRQVLSGVFTALKPGYVELAKSYEMHVLDEKASVAGKEPGGTGASTSSENPTAELKTMTVRPAASRLSSAAA